MASYGTFEIVVRGADNCVYHEFTAAGTITPGMLLSLNTSGNVVAHATAAGVRTTLFALPEDVVGNDLADTYASGDNVQCVGAVPGSVIYAIISDSSESIAIGDKLESAGDGTLQEYSASTAENAQSIVGIALDAVDTTATTDTALASQRCRVLII